MASRGFLVSRPLFGGGGVEWKLKLSLRFNAFASLQRSPIAIFQGMIHQYH